MKSAVRFYLCAAAAGAIGAMLAAAETIQNLGVQFQSIGYESSFLYSAGGNTHLFTVYDLTSGGQTQFFDIDLTNGESSYYNTMKIGRGSVYGKAASGSKFYVATNDPCYLYEYTVGGSFRHLRSSGWETNACGATTSDKAAQIAYTAPDGVVFMGTAVRGTLFSVDPATGGVTDFGVIDPPAGNPSCSGCYRFVYSLAADASYVYAGMRDAGANQWWLAIVRRADGTVTSCWKTAGYASGAVSASSDGTQIWYQTPAGWYRIDNTAGACPATAATPPATKPWYMPSNVYFASADSFGHAASLFNTDVDDSDAAADSSTGGQTTMRYRAPAGSGRYTSKTQQLVIFDSALKRLKAKDATSLYLVNGGYGPDAIFDGSSSVVSGRIVKQSTYAIAAAGGYVYFSGYPSSTYRWDPSVGWNLSGSNGAACGSQPASNPCLAVQGWGKYHYYSGVGGDGLVYIASSYERQGRAGGDIGWIDPADGSSGSVQETCDSPRDFIPLQNGATFAYSSSADGGSFNCANTVGKVFIFDTASKSVTASWIPVADAPAQGKLALAPDGDIVGIIPGYPAAGTYTVYKINPSSGAHVKWSPVQLSGSPFGNQAAVDQRPIAGPDGQIWFYDGRGILRLDPATGVVTRYTSAPSVTTMEFAGSTLYFATNTILNRIPAIAASPVTSRRQDGSVPIARPAGTAKKHPDESKLP